MKGGGGQHNERELAAVGHGIQLGQTSSVRELVAVGHVAQLSPNIADAQQENTFSHGCCSGGPNN